MKIENIEHIQQEPKSTKKVQKITKSPKVTLNYKKGRFLDEYA